LFSRISTVLNAETLTRWTQQGQWERNMYSGTGKYEFPNGTVYEGQWVENKMHGEGRYIDAGGREWHGQFYNGTGPGLISMD